MNRNQRKYAPAKTEDNRAKEHEIVEVLPPKDRRNVRANPPMTDSYCDACPYKIHRSQETEPDLIALYESMLKNNIEMDPTIVNAVKQLDKLRQIISSGINKTERSAQYLISQKSVSLQADISKRKNDSSDANNLIKKANMEPLLENINIGNAPRVKVIAESFSTIKRNNLEVRQLDEKIVCVEYDVFDKKRNSKPVQTMRLYFSVKHDLPKENIISSLPALIKKELCITDDPDSRKFDKEICMIDDEDIENRTYIEDLKVLKRQFPNKQNQSELDLLSLYEMARGRVLDQNFTNIISKAKLDEFKNVILSKTSSSIYGFNRRVIKNGSDLGKCERAISQSLFAKLTSNEL